jgi:hypothetical protein
VPDSELIAVTDGHSLDRLPEFSEQPALVCLAPLEPFERSVRMKYAECVRLRQMLGLCTIARPGTRADTKLVSVVFPTASVTSRQKSTAQQKSRQPSQVAARDVASIRNLFLELVEGAALLRLRLEHNLSIR